MAKSPIDLRRLNICRRTFLGKGMVGLGAVALSTMVDRRVLEAAQGGGLSAAQGPWRGAVNPLHHPAKAKRVIYLYQAGGPSHLETFDYKPKLGMMHGEAMPESFTKGQQLAQLQQAKLVCYGPQFKFRKYGTSGQEMTELFPNIGSVADDLCIVRSMYGEQIN